MLFKPNSNTLLQNLNVVVTRYRSQNLQDSLKTLIIYRYQQFSSQPDKEIKQQLKLIVDRRNKIAHEADIDPTLSLGNRWDMDESMVNDAVDFIEQVVESIHQIL